MNLIIDVGNTSVKIAIFNAKELILVKKDPTVDEVYSFLSDNKIKHCILSKVGDNSDFDNLIGVEVLLLNHKTNFPIKLNYNTPETLGVDRIATMCAIDDLYPKTAALVIDIGTCITYDFLNTDREFEGGVISAGPLLRAKAMHNFTATLPLIDSVNKSRVIGRSTKECMESGIYNSISFEIDGFVNTFRQKFPEGIIILTGGYAKTFESNIKESIFVDSNLVFKGLNRILNFNNEK